MFHNVNEGIENIWTYTADFDRPAVINAFQRSVNLRLTWQADPKNKFSLFVDDQGRCQCANVTATVAPEAAIEIKYPVQRMATVGWTSPRTNRLLLEARGGYPQGELQVQRRGRQRSAEAADHGHRAGLGERRARQHAVPRRRHRRRDRHPALSEHQRPQLRRAVLGLVHHRDARLQGRRQRHHRAPRRVAGRQHLQRQLPLQQHDSRTRSPSARHRTRRRSGSRPASASTCRTSGRSTG